MSFNSAVESYKKNISTAFGFALLLVFVLPLTWLSNSIVSSGTVLIDYGFLRMPIVDLVLMLVFSLAFLFFYSLLVCLMIFSVRKDLSHVKIKHFLNEKIILLATKYFRFLAVFTIIGAVISSFLLEFGFPVFAINILIFVLSSSFLFLGQTIVVDEESLRSSISSNWEFIMKHPRDFLFVIVLGVVGVIILLLIEFVLDYFFLVGSFFSLILSLVLLVPFLEVFKTRIYMKRFDLIRSYHSAD